jgi:hypothetical protein
MASLTTSATIAGVGRMLEARSDELVELQLAALKAHPSYPQLRELDLRMSARRNVCRAVVTMRADPRDGGGDREKVTSTVQHVVPGLAPEEVISAFRTVMAVIRDAYVEEASALCLPQDCLADGLRRLWSLTDRFSDLLAAAHSRSRTAAMRRQIDRLEILCAALLGDLSAHEVERLPPVLDIEPDAKLTVFRLNSPTSSSPTTLAQIHEQAAGWPIAPLVTRIGDELAGLIRGDARAIDDAYAVLAVSAPVTLSDLSAGFRDAGSVLNTARRFGMIGVVDAQRMGLRPAVLAVPRLSEALYDRYVRAVFEATPMASDLLNTVEVFLVFQRRFQRVALELNMHVNSLRHRLERYREITGADLAETETVAEVWWALQHRRATDVAAVKSDE